MNMELITAIALGVALSASCGFRIFVPMLVASVAAHLGVFPAHEGFQWLGSWAAMICFGTATIIEIIAYYIPFVDDLLDSVTTPLSVGAGTLLLTSVLPIDNEMLKWLTGFIVGGGMAFINTKSRGGSNLEAIVNGGLKQCQQFRVQVSVGLAGGQLSHAGS